MVLITLRFYATGTFYKTMGDIFGVSNSTVCLVITRVSHALAKLCTKYIYFPKTSKELKNIERGFFEIAKFPRVAAALDCTHVKIMSPGIFVSLLWKTLINMLYIRGRRRRSF